MLELILELNTLNVKASEAKIDFDYSPLLLVYIPATIDLLIAFLGLRK
jgi:hypothetical protein